MADYVYKRKNPYDPFDNPTENCAYRTDYRDIDPEIDTPDYEPPLLPARRERKNIRRYFNAAGMGLLLGAVFVNIVFVLLVSLLEFCMTGSIDYSDMLDAESYIYYDSSILIAMNGLLFLVANTVPSVIGCRATGIRLRSLFRPLDTKKGELVRYMFIGIFIQAITGILYALVSTIMEAGGIQDYAPEIDSFVNVKATVATGLYTCLIAPVTEELLYRGFVLKNLSRVSQHFGIIVSAVLFGLAHENIAQFLLALPTGIFMARLVVKHNSLIPSILVHMAVNTMAFFMEMIFYFTPESMGVLLFLLDVVYYVVAAAGLVFWILEVRKTRLPANTIRQSYRGVRIALTTPWLMAAVLFHLGMTIVGIVSQNSY
ncbi:MAG: CPBP family intramembrane metalloprotease [Ruminococcus sp.]|nr:CPBP family intramembrane metalloprotease [Ruminococcus sp.]